MHVSPTGTKFIIARKQCVLKPFSNNIIAAFKLLHKSVEKYHNKSKFLGHFGWSKIKKRVIDTLNKLSNWKAARCVLKSEFSTFYTKKAYDELNKTLDSARDFASKGRTQNKIYVK